MSTALRDAHIKKHPDFLTSYFGMSKYTITPGTPQNCSVINLVPVTGISHPDIIFHAARHYRRSDDRHSWAEHLVALTIT
jgi:hypothetical protein